MRKFVRIFATLDRPGGWLDLLARQNAASGPLEAARRRSFLLPRLAFAGATLLAAPAWVLVHGAPTQHEASIFLLAQTPLVCVALLARTGQLRLAQSLSILGWLAMAAAVGALAGGFGAAPAALLAVALLEAALAPGLLLPALAGAGAVLLVATAAGAGLSGAESAALSAGSILMTAPPLLYGAAMAMCAVRAERIRSQSQSSDARDLRLLTNAIGDIVLHLDRSGAVASIIGDTHRTYGLDRRDLIGRGFFQRVHVADRPAFLKLVSDAAEDSAPLTGALRVQVGLSASASGDYAEPVFNDFDARMCRAQPAFNEANGGAIETFLPVVCILRDVTAQKRADEAIAAARAESERATAMKTRFLANVSHELRTPLNAIIGFSEMLANPALAPTDPERQREYAGIIANSGNHLLQVVNTILDMSKIEAGSMQLYPEPFALPALIDECCDMVQLKADQGGVRLLREYRRDIAELVADRRACKQILLNLLSNAVKFTPAGGRVWVRVAPEGNLLAVTVADTGIGIAPTDLARLGDPFFQASATHDRAYEGTGLGLSVVRGLVGLHGGAISVESAIRKGVAVTIRLPLDCRGFAPGAPAKIEAIPRHDAVIGADIRNDEDVVKKIA
ncbi:MAG: ATP-binding protein [Methylocystis sp.]|uniref:PAS domain-containing sensor histidine kinase n=1 Tax=Methylocystis sp. TaxID=1911079 RepID=UPI003DA4AECF